MTITVRCVVTLLSFLGAILVIDTSVLFALGKFNFGTVVPFLIGLIFLVHAIFWAHIQTTISKSRLLKILWRSAWRLFGVWLFSFIAFIIIAHRQINTTKASTSTIVDAIIILGSGTVKGRPTQALANRLDSAVPIIQAQPKALAITTGGVGFGKIQSEAKIMAEYLSHKHNIALPNIEQEGKSTSTEENLKFSQPILAKHGISLDAPIAIVTNDFHTVRAKAIAEKQGYTNVTTVASETPLSIRFNAWFREYFAFGSGWLLDEY